MANQIEIQALGVPIHGTIRPPGSKSITNRAMVCAALARGQSVLKGVLASDDTKVMIECLRKLGISVSVDPLKSIATVEGCDGKIPNQSGDLFVGNSGTTIRFLTAMVALGKGAFRLDGIARMRERPIRDLADALSALGATLNCESPNGCPPVEVIATGLQGGQAKVRGDISSQFLSGLLMASPYANQPVEVHVDGTLVSKPYVQMTLDVMRTFGSVIEDHDYQRFVIPSGKHYEGKHYEVEPDASAASYFWAAAAITGGSITVEGLNQESLQGDVAFCDCLAQMGCAVEYGPSSTTVTGRTLSGITVDMNAISDTVQTLAAIALFAEGPTTIRNVDHIRHKETDRIGNLAIELRKLGATVEELSDGLTIVPGKRKGASIATYDDHRMAMSLSLVGLMTPGVIIEDPDCTRKTYPNFFADLHRLQKTSDE